MPHLSRFLWMAASVVIGWAVVILCVRFPLAIFLLIVAGLWHKSRWRGSGYAHGTASHASITELAYYGMLNGFGLILGRASYSLRPRRKDAIRMLWSPRCRSDVAVRLCIAVFWRSRKSDKSIVRVQQYTHLATFAGTGRGKGVSVVIPNVLAYMFGLVIIDIKAEIFRETADHRRQLFGHKIIVLDPTGMSGEKTAVLNPLDFIDPNAPDFLDQCRDLASSLVVVVGTEHEPHWNEWARVILTAFIAFVAACEPNPEKRTLKTVRFLVSSKRRFVKAMRAMQGVQGFGGVIRELGHQLTWLAGEERGGVLTTVQRHTEWMDSPAVAAVFAGPSTFDPRELRSGKVTVYLILPPERLVSMAGLMRMWINTLLRVTTRGVPTERNPILFMLDEFGHLGHLQAIEDAVTLMRGYGIRLWFIWQSPGQVRKNFGERANIVLDNIDTQQFFGINSYESAEAISKRGGDATILIGSLNRTRSRSRPERHNGQDNGSISTSTSLTLSEHGRALYRPDEVIRLPDDMALVFHKNMPVIPVQLLRFYDSPEFRNGGIGKDRGVGLSGLFGACVALALSLWFAAIAVLLPPFVPPRRAVSPGFPPPRPEFSGKGGFGGRGIPGRPGFGPSPAWPNPIPLQPWPYAPPGGGVYQPPPPHVWRGTRRAYP
jgi:type IV secretion system protein VirD4